MGKLMGAICNGLVGFDGLYLGMGSGFGMDTGGEIFWGLRGWD